MAYGLVRITQNLSFDDLESGKVSSIDAYHVLVNDWIIKPAQEMAKAYPNETDHGMALLALLLMFFEPHGQFLSGESSENQSRVKFCLAFDRFRTFLTSENLISNDAESLSSDLIYKWARCGLFHSGRLSTDLLIDAVDYSPTCLGKNHLLGGWLVNPWKMLPALSSYIETYITDLKRNNEPVLSTNFQATFDRLINEPIRHFSIAGSA